MTRPIRLTARTWMTERGKQEMLGINSPTWRDRIAARTTIGAMLVTASTRADDETKKPDEARARESTAAPSQETQPYVRVDVRGKDKAACDNEDSDDCPCDTKCCGWGHGRWRRRCNEPSVSLSVIGVRPALTSVSTDARSSSDIGVGFAGAVDSYALSGKSHASMQWMLGGGQAGFEGQLAGVVEFGHRVDVTEHQGPFGRIGFDGRLQGNDAFYYSALELPRLTAGWQFATKRAVLELGARGGPILTGRFNPGDGVRSTTGSWEFGGVAAAQVEFFRLEATAFRMDGRNTGDHTPVDVGRATFCAMAGRLGICGDFMALSGSANMGTPAAVNMQDALVTYMGLTIGASRW